jgi:chromosome segregation ATPase
LNTDLETQNRRITDLQTQIRDLNTQVAEAQVILSKAGNLDKSIDPLSEQVRTLQYQLLDLKQKLDGLKSALGEKKDRAIFLNKKTKKLALNKEGRNQTMSLLAETAEDIQVQIAEIENKRHRLIGYR